MRNFFKAAVTEQFGSKVNRTLVLPVLGFEMVVTLTLKELLFTTESNLPCAFLYRKDNSFLSTVNICWLLAIIKKCAKNACIIGQAHVIGSSTR